MSYLDLKKIKSLYFTYNEVADAVNITSDSARVLCSRYAAKGILLRIKRNIYVLRDRWEYLDELELMRIANVIRVPSYVSLTTALSYYGYTTQIQQNFIESVCMNKPFNRSIERVEFNYNVISRKYYGEFYKHNGVFIASPEKAFIDALYLTSLGKYGLDFSALETSKLDMEKVAALIAGYPEKTKRLWRNHAPTRST